MRWLLTSRVILVIIFALACDARAATFVIPPGLEDVPGDDGGGSPFTAPFSARSQILYDSSFFPTPLVIESIAFRLDTTIPNPLTSAHFTISDIQINMSTFSGDSLSETLTSNVGADEAVALSRGALRVDMDSADSFDFVIQLDRPFTYDPARGGLLVDIYKYSDEFETVNFDAHRVAYAGTVTEDFIFDDGEGYVLDRVLVAEISGEPVPEPSSLTIAVIAAVGSIAWRWRRRRRSA